VPRTRTKTKYHTAYIGLGSNLGDRQIFIAFGLKWLSRLDRTRITKLSGLYATEPVGIDDRTPFLNIVVKISTPLQAQELLTELQRIEKDAGRTESQSKKSRVLDMDILFFDNDIIIIDDLVIPHPELHKRRFMLQPLAEIASDLVHPVEQKTIQELLNESDNSHWVKRLP